MACTAETKNRDRQPLTTAQQDLALRYLPLARSLAKPFKAHWPHLRDDFESAACLAIVEAAEGFDPSRNVKFATYARHRVWGALRDIQRAQIAMGFRCDPKQAPTFSTFSSFQAEVGRGRVLGSEIDEGPEWATDDHDAIEARLKHLPAKHAAALRWIYCHGMTQHQAARKLGISQSRLSYMHREAIAMLDGSFTASLLSSALAASLMSEAS